MANIDQHYKKPCLNCGHRNLHGELSGCIANKAEVGQPADWCDCATYVSPVPTPTPRQRTRATDPETSHAAAASLTVDDLRVNQAAVLAALNAAGPMPDVALVDWYTEAAKGDPDYPRQSQSGIRTRRAELVAGGLVKDTGDRVTLESGRQAIVWSAA